MTTQTIPQINESMGIQDEWYKEAGSITIGTLPDFITKLTQDYHHDYGTICHAMAAAAIATAWAINSSPAGGITGFQSGAVMWQFIKEWNYKNNKTGLKIIDYDNFFYPQYWSNYEKTITTETWKVIQQEVKSRINEADKDYEKYIIDKAQYEIDIAAFVKKYPDYYENKNHYDHLGMGTGAEWQAEKIKKETGFEFAPNKPYEPINEDSDVYKHWLSILNGEMPFGFYIKD